jgi:hypothetical protein
MKKNIYFLAFIVLGLLMLGGCRTSPLLNIDDAPIAVSGNYTMDDVKNAIVHAGVSLGWQMRPKEPGRIEGILYLRTHMAKIDIMYDKTKYSIHYKDSKNLNYDGTNIHTNYNGWIQRLDQTIQAQLTGM